MHPAREVCAAGASFRTRRVEVAHFLGGASPAAAIRRLDRSPLPLRDWSARPTLTLRSHVGARLPEQSQSGLRAAAREAASRAVMGRKQTLANSRNGWKTVNFEASFLTCK